MLVVPDVNSDGAVDLATVCKTEGGVSGAVLVHSGSNGQLLGTIAPDSDRVRLSFGDRTQLALLENTTNGAPQIVATGRSKERTAVLAVFELPGK